MQNCPGALKRLLYTLSEIEVQEVVAGKGKTQY